ncbi:helix-turn-helix transcriptional regulator [Paenibacillus contaminans]|uniref:XRE family transcriptional regulator n=1 Tax=Paenibacillus contaminans TaxID=450362 RepID=A0A329MWL7_9BACL|nr:helix-turn-helix transcriptional regulator [Paenibacillus contaminans]RAV22227.1 XRE family transcriptional regulator [Paenibacillus contaminans]
MIRKRLKEIREEKKKSFKQVAEAVGVSKPYYWQIENGKRGLSYELAVKIASYFESKPDQIFLPEELTKCLQGEQAV